MTLCILSYNVHGLRDDLEALYSVVRDATPDVVMFQEIPRFWRWRSRAAKLAARTELEIAVGGGGRAYGNMIAVRPGIVVRETGVIRLPKSFMEQPRAAVWAQCESGGGIEFTAVGVHLGHDPVERYFHMAYLFSALPPGPLILGGDFNEESTGKAWHFAALRLQDAGKQDSIPTYSAQRPRRRIDATFVERPLQVKECHVLDSEAVRRASDHCPVRTVVGNVTAP